MQVHHAATSLSGELTMLSAEQQLKTLSARLKSGDSLHLDLAKVTRADSAALSLLFELARQGAAQGKSFTLQNVPAPLISLAKLYGADTLLDKFMEPAR
ncbi:STAS domain-containing protein [Craterilacuibacter sinensis]|uniref:STAS domain-containing protein n=1 Tax=Craterilacuibacter sinensis TaxID=2686017 RepID=A0A845BUG4_9NEIS|nr:STAS domain-containing protein [Craterilacuibacter sinensis]MXR38251.1 STAS domain-containing protein [Craterilacuibacter sinensis]